MNGLGFRIFGSRDLSRSADPGISHERARIQGGGIVRRRNKNRHTGMSPYLTIKRSVSNTFWPRTTIIMRPSQGVHPLQGGVPRGSGVSPDGVNGVGRHSSFPYGHELGHSPDLHAPETACQGL